MTRSEMNSGIWRKLVPGIVVLALALGACGGGEAGREAANLGSYTLPGEQVFPEGIAYQAQSGDFFVGSTTDGTVYRGNTANEGEERPRCSWSLEATGERRRSV